GTGGRHVGPPGVRADCLGLGTHPRPAARGGRRQRVQELAAPDDAPRRRRGGGGHPPAHALHARLGEQPLRRPPPGAVAGRIPGGAARRDQGVARGGAGVGRGGRHDRGPGRRRGGTGRAGLGREPVAAPCGGAPRRRAAFRLGGAAGGPLHLRHLHRRQAQRVRARLRAARGGAAGLPGLQPAVPLRRRRPGQDAPDALDRLGDPRPPTGAHGRLHVGREVHVPLHRRAALPEHHGVQGDAARRRCADDRRPAIPDRQGQHAGGVLPHLQRAGGPGQADRRLLRQAALRPRRHRGPAAHAPRLRHGGRHPRHHLRAAPVHPGGQGRRGAGGGAAAGAGAARAQDRHQHPRAGGRAEPAAGARQPVRPPGHGGFRARGAARPPARAREAGLDRGHSEAGGGTLQHPPHRHVLGPPRPQRRPPAPSGDVPGEAAHPAVAPRDRPALRQPRPHHGYARRVARVRADGGGRGLRRGRFAAAEDARNL
ncbi:MAG: Chromosomal replication initiator protein DnaA, partial [uncultured Acetobacteraceae bacterium]